MSTPPAPRDEGTPTGPVAVVVVSGYDEEQGWLDEEAVAARISTAINLRLALGWDLVGMSAGPGAAAWFLAFRTGTP